MKSRTANIQEGDKVKEKLNKNSNKISKKTKKKKRELITIDNEINSNKKKEIKEKKNKTKLPKNKTTTVSHEKVNRQNHINVVQSKHKKNKVVNDTTQKLENNDNNNNKKFKKSKAPKSFEISVKTKNTGNEGKESNNKSKDKKQKNKFNKERNKAQKLKIIKERKMKKEKLQIIAKNNLTPIERSKKIKYNKNHVININHLKKILEPIEKHKSTVKETSPKSNLPESSSLRDKMMEKLRASRFRYINETLYTSESSEAKRYFRDNPDDFTAYHNGYKQQVSQWPLNPLDVIISSIQKLPKDYTIADFGCGEAHLAESVPQNVHSLDLVAVNERVKACDMAHTPLLTNSVNVVVFCLSLMGTNLADYLKEANRVLKNDGILKIAEVESRFDDVEDFIKTLKSYGFTNTWKDLSHNLFYFMDFKKSENITVNRNKLPEVTLKPCLYKKR